MADINFNKLNDEQVFHKSTELLYFAYRDYISWPDDLLQTYGFGRAHHRILYFVSRRPGMTVAELLKLLNITKQSLSRVISSLIDKKYITQQIGENDRRQRLLFISDKGKYLLDEVSVSQKTSILKASQQVGPEAVEGFWKMLSALTSEDDK